MIQLKLHNKILVQIKLFKKNKKNVFIKCN